MNKIGLGKGLSALISEGSLDSSDQAYIPNLPIDNIEPNPYQPRIEIKPETLVELTDSIREHGIIEPLIVKRISPSQFQLIAGERRLRAAKLAGAETVAVVVLEASPQQMLELAVVENIQRQDLNPLEEALAFDQMVKHFNMGHEEISNKVGYSRPAIANKIRLLTLPDELKKGLLEGTISEGHARALLGLHEPQAMIATYALVVKNQISVRATEELVRRLLSKSKDKSPAEAVDEPTTDTLVGSIELFLSKKFNSKISVSRSKRGGKIIIPFKNDKELDRIYGILAS
ncbi:ParB/RepB/Spo0J family partition protein [Candidatus Dojkabacteria bacterium]|nr:ParB/RepB/Spo0J family partition protein [Candidatus Dojkabacteria bacterium]